MNTYSITFENYPDITIEAYGFTYDCQTHVAYFRDGHGELVSVQTKVESVELSKEKIEKVIDIQQEVNKDVRRSTGQLYLDKYRDKLITYIDELRERNKKEYRCHVDILSNLVLTEIHIDNEYKKLIGEE